jgi:hypothetical protein
MHRPSCLSTPSCDWWQCHHTVPTKKATMYHQRIKSSKQQSTKEETKQMVCLESLFATLTVNLEKKQASWKKGWESCWTGEEEKEKGMERRRKAHIGRQTAVKSSTVDVRMTAEQYGPSHLHIRTEWHYHSTLFVDRVRRKRWIDSTR